MSKSAWAWVWLGFLVVLDILVPWFILNRVAKMNGVFLFWILWASAAIVSAYVIFLKWREVQP